VGTHVSIATAS